MSKPHSFVSYNSLNSNLREVRTGVIVWTDSVRVGLGSVVYLWLVSLFTLVDPRQRTHIPLASATPAMPRRAPLTH